MKNLSEYQNKYLLKNRSFESYLFPAELFYCRELLNSIFAYTKKSESLPGY